MRSFKKSQRARYTRTHAALRSFYPAAYVASPCSCPGTLLQSTSARLPAGVYKSDARRPDAPDVEIRAPRKMWTESIARYRYIYIESLLSLLVSLSISVSLYLYLAGDTCSESETVGGCAIPLWRADLVPHNVICVTSWYACQDATWRYKGGLANRDLIESDLLAYLLTQSSRLQCASVQWRFCGSQQTDFTISSRWVYPFWSRRRFAIIHCHCDKSKGDPEFIIECGYAAICAIRYTRVKIYEILIYYRLIREKPRVRVRGSVSDTNYIYYIY